MNRLIGSSECDAALTSNCADAANLAASRWLAMQEIGRGGHGVVYRALDTLVGREVALKTSADSNHERGTARLRREAELLARVSDPNVVTLYDILQRPDGVALAMELVDGPSLDSFVRQRLTTAEIVALGRQLASGVQALHRAGVVHGDIKPSNLRLSSTGVLKILDLGIAQDTGEADEPDLGRPMTSGTRGYMAPELRQVEGTDRGRTPVRPLGVPSVLSDVWSIGAVLFELATGTRWCDEQQTIDDTSATQRPVVRLRRRLGYRRDESGGGRRRFEGPPAVAGIIECALATSPDARFQSAKALGEALERGAHLAEPLLARGRRCNERRTSDSLEKRPRQIGVARETTRRAYALRTQQLSVSLNADATAP